MASSVDTFQCKIKANFYILKPLSNIHLKVSKDLTVSTKQPNHFRCCVVQLKLAPKFNLSPETVK